MRNNLRRFVDDERGMSLVFVGVGFMALLAATTLAIDVGMFMTARSQAQNAADAGAHAGAVALRVQQLHQSNPQRAGGSERDQRGDEEQGHGRAVYVTSADVTFPLDPAGTADRVQVQVYRTAAKLNAGRRR